MTAHPQRNENAWLLGQAFLKNGFLGDETNMGMVGARGLEPHTVAIVADPSREHTELRRSDLEDGMTAFLLKPRIQETEKAPTLRSVV